MAKKTSNTTNRRIKHYGIEAEVKVADKENILQSGMRFDIIEAYKAARTNIIYSLVEDGSKIICVTSSSPEEGKSTSCINLAVTFAQTGAKVLLIDGDLRKPRIHWYLKLHSKPGLTNVLGGFSLVTDAIQTTSYENLHVLTCGHIPPNPTELLASSNMGTLLNMLKASYDYIFVDTPPINTVTDAAVLSKLVSGTILVVRQGITTLDDVGASLKKLKLVNAKILGFLLNDVSQKSKYYKHKYKYRNYYEDK